LKPTAHLLSNDVTDNLRFKSQKLLFTMSEPLTTLSPTDPEGINQGKRFELSEPGQLFQGAANENLARQNDAYSEDCENVRDELVYQVGAHLGINDLDTILTQSEQESVIVLTGVQKKELGLAEPHVDEEKPVIVRQVYLEFEKGNAVFREVEFKADALPPEEGLQPNMMRILLCARTPGKANLATPDSTDLVDSNR
jgi:hypothetical protein